MDFHIWASIQKCCRMNNKIKGEFVVRKLIDPYTRKGHCIATDNYLTSLKLVRSLLNIDTLFIGTMKKNKKYIPPDALAAQSIYSTKCFEDEKGVLLTSYQCKPKKNVLLLSTDHDKGIIPSLSFNETKKKPNTVLTYNVKKVGVDAVDQMARGYNVKAPTRRWPVCVFYNIINLATINSWILYYSINNSNISRKYFILKLVEEIKALTPSRRNILSPSTPVQSPQVKRRHASDSQVQSTNKELFPSNASPIRKAFQIRRNCTTNKTSDKCSNCKLWCCSTCAFTKYSVVICTKCNNRTDKN